MPCFGWGPFPTLCWSSIPTGLVNTKMQLAGVRAALVSLQQLSPWDPKRGVKHFLQLHQIGEMYCQSFRARKGLGTLRARVGAINICLFVMKNSRREAEPYHWSQPPCQAEPALGSRTLKAAQPCTQAHIGSLWHVKMLLPQQNGGLSPKPCKDLLQGAVLSWGTHSRPWVSLLFYLPSVQFLWRWTSSVWVAWWNLFLW